ncbi:DUF4145 domain-containing protein [Microbacterium sp.]|uniref:DUF4145 domain-containing protein n=1 Tax=Microbacterium sp. TaxID=51671 RepID=UPI0037C8AB33
MPEDDETDVRFRCPHCNAYSHHLRFPLLVRLAVATGGFAAGSFSDKAEAFRVEGTRMLRGGDSDDQWHGTLCVSCSRSAVWRDSALMFPLTGGNVARPHPDMPEEARELYEEAVAVLPRSRRAAAALARAALESLLKELAPAGGKPNLQARIAELRDQINPSLWKVLTALRVVGNDALHGDTDDLIIMYLNGEMSETVEPFFEAINSLVEQLLTQPRVASEIYERIPAPKREAAERDVR